MGKRSLKPAPSAPAIDELDDLPEEVDERDDDGDLWDDEGDVVVSAGAHAAFDAASDAMSRAFPQGTAGDVDDDAKSSQPVNDLLSRFALGTLSKRMLAMPLAAQSNEWVQTALHRVETDIAKGDDSSEVMEELLLDQAVLRAAATLRGLVPGDATSSDDADDADDATPPITEREASPGTLAEVHINEIEPDPDQPRLAVDDELAASIRAQGVLQPLVVRPNPLADSSSPYRLVDGERRWRGARAAGLATVPVRIVGTGDAGDILLRQVTYNTGKPLAPMEEAKAWKRIMDAKGWNIQQLASALGRAKSTVSDRLAILDAPAPFQDLLVKGLLGAAVGPVLREYRDVPERILKAVVKDLVEDEYEGWGKFVEGGVPVPIEVVKETLESTLLSPWGDHLRPLDKSLEAAYTGPVATVKGKKYAVDLVAYSEASAEQTRRSSKSSTAAGAAQRELSKYELESKARQREERAAVEKKRELRRLQWAALAPRVPTSLDGAWARLLVRWLTQEVQQEYQRMFLKAMNIEPKKSSGRYGGFDFQSTVIAEAEALSAGERVRFALQLLLAHDLTVSQYDMRGADRFAAAAELLKIDLKKITAPDPAKKPGTALVPIAKAQPKAAANKAIKGKLRTPVKYLAKNKAKPAKRPAAKAAKRGGKR